jgi:hypothetical protein
MLPATPLLLLATALGLVTAHPVKRQPSNCGVLNMPYEYFQLHQDDPDTAYPNTAPTDQSVLIYQDVNANGTCLLSSLT